MRTTLWIVVGVGIMAGAHAQIPGSAPGAPDPKIGGGVSKMSVPQSMLSVRDTTAWHRILRSIIRIEDRHGTIAVLIDRSGLFLAPDLAGATPTVRAFTAEGRVIKLTLVTIDDSSQIALWQTPSAEVQDLLPAVVADRESVAGALVYAATPEGPTKGHFVAWGRVGVIKPSLRYVPLSEIRFEAVPRPLGGAPIFLADGRLAGLVGATLEPVNQVKRMDSAPSYFGPMGVTVGYSLGTTVLDRVVTGFRSPSQRPEHPAIGAFFRDAGEPGALVVEVMEGSPSAKAGLREGDVITQLDQVIISNAVDLAALLFDQRVGRVIRVTIRRRGEAEAMTLPITVGRRAETLSTRKVLQTPP